MDISKILKNKTCYIVSKELKHEILAYLTENKLLLDIHFFNINDFINRIYFKYDSKAIYRVSKLYNLSYDNAKIMIENIKYTMYSKNINDEKIKLLENIKTILDNENLLIYDSDFLSFLNGYSIISDLNEGNDFLYKINELMPEKIEFIKLEKKENITINEFYDSDEEISYIANEICILLEKGVAPGNIHILNANDSYTPYINKIFTLYNIPFMMENKNVLYDLNEYKTLYDNYKNDFPILEENECSSNFNEIVESLSFIDDNNDKKNFLLYLLKNTRIKNTNYTNIINFSSYETVYLDDHYYFFIGTNNTFPIIKKDEDYLQDSLKKDLGYIDSPSINNLTRNYCINRLSSNSNIFISYRTCDYFNKYLRSDIVKEIASKIEHPILDNKFSYSYDRLKLARELDNFYKYNIDSDSLKILSCKIKQDKYKTYDNSYSKVDSNYYIDNILDKKISVSYSSFQKFNECQYKYYLDSILKENSDTFNTYIGTLFHHILERIYDSDFDFNECLNQFENDYKLNEKEEILLSNLLVSFKDKIDIILAQYKLGNFKKIKKEENISLYIKSDLSIKITGFIDKIMLNENGQAYLIDYKTGDNKITLDYLEHGLNCQLPFYFYLLNKSKMYADVFLVGCYLQIINFKIKNCSDNSKEMLLEGLTYEDASIISEIDPLYESESFIKGIKPNKKGLGTYAKTYNSDDFNFIIEKMDENINKMINDIKNANFEINPKLMKKKETTCKYCNYRDICYRDFKNFIDIRKVNDYGVD